MPLQNSLEKPSEGAELLSGARAVAGEGKKVPEEQRAGAGKATWLLSTDPAPALGGNLPSAPSLLKAEPTTAARSSSAAPLFGDKRPHQPPGVVPVLN